MFKLPNREIRFEVTNLCNAECVFCPRDRQTRKQSIMDFGMFKKWFDEIHDNDYGIDYVSLEGFGEPFIDPHLFERAKYVKDRGYFTSVVSTGSLWDRKLQGVDTTEYILKYIDKVRISHYGMTSDVYEELQKNLKFERVVKNIEELFSRRGDKKSPRIEMYYLLMPENEHQLDDWLEKWEPIADGVSVWKPHNWGGTGREYREIKKENRRSCGRPFNGPFQIQWNGNVIPCCLDYDGEISLGNVNSNTIQEVFNSKEYEDFREAHRSGNFEKYSFCDNCDQLQEEETEILVYSNIEGSSVGSVNSSYDALQVG